MDEPASALDPIATQRIEELIYQLKTRYTIVIVTHNMQQAARVSDVTAFFWLGKLIECGRTRQDLHGAVREADRGLRDGKVRLMASVRTASSGISRRSSSSSRRGCSKWAGSPRSRCAWRSRAWSSATAISSTRVLVGDEPLNALHIEVDNRCFTLLALYQPMAVDLRAIVAAVKINTDLERVGDLAVNIAEAARRYVDHPPVKKLIDIPRMATIAQRCCATRSTRSSAATRRSPSSVLNEDDALDALKTQIFRELLTYMLQDPGDHRAGARPDPGLAPPRTHRRPRHQHRRGRDLHGLGQRRPPPRRRRR